MPRFGFTHDRAADGKQNEHPDGQDVERTGQRSQPLRCIHRQEIPDVSAYRVLQIERIGVEAGEERNDAEEALNQERERAIHPHGEHPAEGRTGSKAEIQGCHEHSCCDSGEDQTQDRRGPKNVLYERRSGSFLFGLLIGWKLVHPILLRLWAVEQDVGVCLVPSDFLLYGQAKAQRDQNAE